MWILKWLPNWIFYGILFLGIIGLIASYFVRFLAKFIPPLYIYKTPIQLISLAMVVIGTFMAGAIHDNDAWVARVKEMEEKVKVAEEKSNEANKEIVEKLVVKNKIIKEKGEEVVKYIDREVVKYDTKFQQGDCALPKEFVQSINKAAETPK